MPKRKTISAKVDRIKPNLVKIRAYKKRVMIAKTALPHFKPFHKSLNVLASLFHKMFLMMRTIESDPRIKLAQKKRNPEPGEENVPTPN